MVPPFFAEQLGNIHLIRATLAADKTCKVDTLLAIKEQALWLKENKLMQLPVSENASLALMTVVPLEQPSVHNNVLWDIKLSAHTPKACLQEPKEWLPAKEMKTLQVLDCHHCHAPLLKAEDARVPFKHKDLPSEHWYELVECWICHETKPEEHKARMKPILAKPDVFLVGATYFLVHVDNLVQGCTAMDPHVASKINWDSGTFTKWIAIQCTHCNAPLGEGHYEQHKEAKVLRAVKLFKYCVSIHPSPAAQPTFIDFLVCDMVEAAKAHATYRFIIQGRSSEKVYALIWLFNWDTRVFYNDGFVGSGESSTLYNERVMKVFYLDCASSPNEQTVKHLATWSNDKSADHLFYPDTYCMSLLKSLQKTTLYLPPHMRTMHHPAMQATMSFSVGFIKRP